MAQESEDGKKPKGNSINLRDPLFVWVFILLIAVSAEIINSSGYVPKSTSIYSMLNTYANFVLVFPGIIIVPVIMGAIIGSEVGLRSSNINSALRTGMMNGLYASVVYTLTIVIIYFVIIYSVPQFITVYSLILDNIIVPLLVFIIVIEVFAVLSHSRKVDS